MAGSNKFDGLNKVNILTKTINYIKDRYLRVKGTTQTFHQRMLQTNIHQLETYNTKSPQQNPYQMFQSWSLEQLMYGSIITFILNVWFGWQGLSVNMWLVPANGLTVWMLLELVRRLREAVKGQ